MELSPNALQSTKQVCELFANSRGRTFALIVSHPPDLPMAPPLSASFICSFYSLPLIGISARHSVFSDKYSHASFLRTVPPFNKPRSFRLSNS
ncbi:unnamed protein product [Protopolystoma xenopodis]|uniref:Uncharacterized protein n=1 Tax=Protopolystoma xenopodis TaxID=117903 RepID=A0A3S5CJ63_9PLAT|nr:unnamed protein product [Protopolystoma xenopodis]